MNQRFTVRVTVEFHVWPKKDNVDIKTVQDCAMKIANDASPIFKAISAQVIEEIPVRGD